MFKNNRDISAWQVRSSLQASRCSWFYIFKNLDNRFLALNFKINQYCHSLQARKYDLRVELNLKSKIKCSNKNLEAYINKIMSKS